MDSSMLAVVAVFAASVAILILAVRVPPSDVVDFLRVLRGLDRGTPSRNRPPGRKR